MKEIRRTFFLMGVVVLCLNSTPIVSEDESLPDEELGKSDGKFEAEAMLAIGWYRVIEEMQGLLQILKTLAAPSSLILHLMKILMEHLNQIELLSGLNARQGDQTSDLLKRLNGDPGLSVDSLKQTIIHLQQNSFLSDNWAEITLMALASMKVLVISTMAQVLLLLEAEKNVVEAFVKGSLGALPSDVSQVIIEGALLKPNPDEEIIEAILSGVSDSTQICAMFSNCIASNDLESTVIGGGSGAGTEDSMKISTPIFPTPNFFTTMD